MKNATNDIRLYQLNNWVEKLFPDDRLEITVASSDASFRRYFRLKRNDSSYIVMDAPPEHEDISSFIYVAEFLSNYGVGVPQIYAKDENNGFLLLSDFGNTSFFMALSTTDADKLYRQAIDQLVAMQKTNPATTILADYDETKLREEMSLFPEWFLSRHLSLQAPETLTPVYDYLIDEISTQPTCFVHRDYHSRNLMFCANGSLGIIDFQDAVIGPIAYDLVSLLKDCYIQWPSAQQQEWLNYYKEQAVNNKVMTESQCKDLERWYDLVGLQRHLNVLGIFCRLNYRDGKSNYLNDLPLTLHYVIEVCKRYNELAPLYEFLTNTPEIMAIK